jgi:MSHA pilin protein MshB
VTFSFSDNNQGFTLIELVVVIAIVSLLAIVSLPKFAALSDAAELAQAKSIASSFNSAAKLVKLTFDSKSHKTRVQNLQGYGDGTIDTNNDGYPIGSTKGNGNENVGVGNAGCADLWRALLINPPTVAHNNNNQDYRSYRHTTNRVCSYVYRVDGDTGNRNTAQLVIRYDSRDGRASVCGRRSDIANCP